MAKRKREPKVYEVVSIHPTYASEEEKKEAQLANIKEWAIAWHNYEKNKLMKQVAD